MESNNIIRPSVFQASLMRHIIRWGFLLLAVLLTISLARNIIRSRAADNKIEEAKAKLEALKKENQELADKLESVNSDEYIEKQARDKLGLAKEGETVIVLPDEEEIKRLAPERQEGEEYLPGPNWKQWLKLFL